MSFLNIGTQTTLVMWLLPDDDLLSLARTCTILWNDTIQHITGRFPWLLPLQPGTINRLFSNQRLFAWARTHEAIMNAFSRREQFVMRQIVTLGPKNGDGSGIREEGPTRAIRKIIHELADIFNCLARTVKNYSESKEEINIGCGCCPCCCTCSFYDDTDEDVPFMGVLVREDGTMKTYIVYESEAVFYICIGPPHQNPKKHNKAIGRVTQPVRNALQYSRVEIPFPVYPL